MSARHPYREIAPEADSRSRSVGENTTPMERQRQENRGSFEGAIRIPLHALSFLLNDLA
jgi:hypothetical protein